VCRGQNDTIPSYIKGKTAVGTRVTDSLPNSDSVRRNGHKESPYKVDSLGRRLHDPRKATIRSAILPGLGQVYNRKYWKLPLVYAAIGIPAYTYFYNRSWYRKCQYALGVIDTYTLDSVGATIPPATLKKVDTKLLPFVVNGDDNSLRTYRNEFRKDQDYSVLFFLLFWGLNVVDATVDAHLMYFDVSDQLSMHLQQPSPGYLAPGSSATGLSLVFDLHKPHYKSLPTP
jgi:hypothetical protein